MPKLVKTHKNLIRKGEIWQDRDPRREYRWVQVVGFKIENKERRVCICRIRKDGELEGRVTSAALGTLRRRYSFLASSLQEATALSRAI